MTWERHVRALGIEPELISTYAKAVERLTPEAWNDRVRDLVVIDMDFPDGDGIDLARMSVSLRPRPAVVAVSGNAAIYSNRLLDVCKCLGKPICMSELVEWAARQANPRQHYASEKGFSRREADVFACRASGMNPKETADALGLSPGTVRTYTIRMCRRVNCQDFEHLLIDYQYFLHPDTGPRRSGVPYGRSAVDGRRDGRGIRANGLRIPSAPHATS